VYQWRCDIVLEARSIQIPNFVYSVIHGNCQEVMRVGGFRDATSEVFVSKSSASISASSLVECRSTATGGGSH
jgi:hypothetical protein